MSSPAQILANQSNAQHSTGPVSPEGKAVVSQNALKLGLFSSTAFVRADEQEKFAQFKADYLAELSPQTLLEETLAREIVQAAWRLRRCAEVETNPPETATPEDLDRLQASIDRARASAQRSLHRSLAELRRIQTERVYHAIALPHSPHPENPGQASYRANAADSQLMNEVIESAKQTQSRPATPIIIARNAPCPCGSREKYKRCCGKTAPPMLSRAA